MSYNRSIEPQILSIEAIIQKSEHKSKLLNNIPIDLKKLFIDQISKRANEHKQIRKMTHHNEGVYSNTIEQTHHEYHYRTKMSMPPLPSKQARTKSLNSSKNNKNMNENMNKLQTTRTAALTRESNRAKRSERRSVDQQLLKGQKISEDFLINKNKLQTVKIIETNTQTKNEESDSGREHKVRQKKFSQFEYQLVLPQKNRKSRGFRKILHSKQKPTSAISQQRLSIQGNQNLVSNGSHIKTESVAEGLGNENSSPNIHTKHFSQGVLKIQNDLSYNQQAKENTLLKRKRIQTLAQNIPEFLVAAIQQEKKKISPLKSTSVKGQKFFQLNLQDGKSNKRDKIKKQSSCVINMKKKITYNKIIRRSEQSIDQILEPKVHFVKLYEKDKTSAGFNRKNSEIIPRQTKKKVKSRDKIPTYHHKIRSKVLNEEEEVKGWDIQEGPQFYDQY